MLSEDEVRIIDQIDARAFNGLSSVLSRLGLKAPWATVVTANTAFGVDGFAQAFFDEQWIVVVNGDIYKV